MATMVSLNLYAEVWQNFAQQNKVIVITLQLYKKWNLWPMFLFFFHSFFEAIIFLAYL